MSEKQLVYVIPQRVNVQHVLQEPDHLPGLEVVERLRAGEVSESSSVRT